MDTRHVFSVVDVPMEIDGMLPESVRSVRATRKRLEAEAAATGSLRFKRGAKPGAAHMHRGATARHALV